MTREKYLIVIGGPTASGKSKVALELAQHFHCKIINADSRQVYKELNIGVNKPPEKDLQSVQHFLIGHKSIFEEYNAGLFESEALQTLDELYKTESLAILAGGTGLYINAVLNGIDKFPDVTADAKEKVNTLLSQGGLLALQGELKNLDPHYFAEVDIQNARRLTRALELIYTTGKAYSSLKTNETRKRSFTPIKIFIDQSRAKLYKSIDQRVDSMMAQGLKEEARDLYPHRHLKSLHTVGYSEWFEHFEGKISPDEAIEKIKQHSRNYAKRQLTWWRPLNWPKFESEELEKMIAHINQSLR